MAQEETQTSQTAEEQKTFTQAEVDDIVKKRLARVKADVPADYEELKSKAQKFDELEEASKSELQKAKEQLEKLKSNIAKRDAQDKQRELRDQVSKETGVPSDLISGTNEDEMKIIAQKIADYAKKDVAPVIKNADKFAGVSKGNSSPYRMIARELTKQMKGL